ncbi:uncharacterized protein LOC143043549 [Mytilus galloprovincialis]|uniref:uncharacterized protein LOC143043549 n=1 Tax=Mytilus galloprovincialis TaxID=29158 RepID=UPI003F7C6256
MISRRASPGISLGADNHGRLFEKSVRERNLKKTKPGVLAAQYRLNVPATKTSQSSKILRPKKHDMVQLVRDEVEESNLFDVPKKEEREVKEIRLCNLDDSDFSDEEDELELYFMSQRPKEKMSQKLYKEACRTLKITPMQMFYKALDTDEIRVIGVTMKPKDTKACAIALCRDSEVEKLTFDGNDLGSSGAMYIADVVDRNTYLIELSITENNIGKQGAEAICEALKNNNYLRKLDLSGNNLTEGDAIHFKEMLDENHALRELHLKHNKFHERGGEIFAEGLAVNDFLKVLDLSWNHLRLRGATAIGRALQKNRHLEKLDISWNGFHLTGAATISYALTMNTALIELDMSCNRLTDACAKCLIKGIEKNSTLKILRLGKNQMYPVSATELLECIDQSISGIQLLDLGDQCVMDTFEKLYNEMKKRRDSFKAIYGYVWDTNREGISQTDVNEDEKDLIDEDPLLVLFEYARLQNFRLLDMFTILDTDKSGSLDKQEFKDGLEQVKIPMSEPSLNLLIKKMDKDGDGEIDFGELISAQKLHKEKLRDFMRAEVDLENTEIGRIDRKIRMVMSRRHLMKKKKTEMKDLLKVLTKAARPVEEDIPVEEKVAKDLKSTLQKGFPKMANLMNFLPDIKQRLSLVAQNDTEGNNSQSVDTPEETKQSVDT